MSTSLALRDDVVRPSFSVARRLSPDPAPALDIVGTLVSSTRFASLVVALVAADLIDDLRSPGPLVLFAPTDAAFDALPPNSFERMLAPERVEALVDRFEHHVARGRLGGFRSGATSRLSSMGGRSITVRADGRIDRSGARVVERLTCRNGVIAVVDRVLVDCA